MLEVLEDFTEYLPNMIIKPWTVSIQYLGNAMLSKLIGFLYEIDSWDCFTNCWTAVELLNNCSKAAPRMPTQKLHRLYAMTLTSSPTPLPVRVVDVDVPGETKVRDFADHAVGEKNVAGREVSVYELKRSGVRLRAVWPDLEIKNRQFFQKLIKKFPQQFHFKTDCCQNSPKR